MSAAPADIPNAKIEMGLDLNATAASSGMVLRFMSLSFFALWLQISSNERDFIVKRLSSKQRPRAVHSYPVNDLFQIRSDCLNAQIQLGRYLLVRLALKDGFHNSAVPFRESTILNSGN
jgi:hypothetical protein